MLTKYISSKTVSSGLSYETRHDKTNKMSVRPAKTQISLGIRPVWSESSLCAQWVAKDPRFLHADSEDSDQTGRTLTLLVLSCRGSIILYSFEDCVQVRLLPRYFQYFSRKIKWTAKGNKYSKLFQIFFFSVNRGNKSYMLTILSFSERGGYENNMNISKQVWQHVFSYASTCIYF